MKFLFASDSFKGSLSSGQIAKLLKQAASEVFPDVLCESVCVADGGEGTVDAVLMSVSGNKMKAAVHDPLGRVIEAEYGIFDQTKAVLEVAEASGLPLLKQHERDPKKTSSFGTGELIRHAIEQGCKDITIAVGGSATNDGGMGCLDALGVRFFDEKQQRLRGCGENLIKISRIDTSNLYQLIRDVHFTVMCDVKNPLCGEHGATLTFAAQKGANAEDVISLEQGMQHYKEILETMFEGMTDMEGGGAAGGLGAALKLFLNAELRSGIDTVLDLIHFDECLNGVSLVVTGEGQTDWQSCYGKVIQGIGNRCQKKGIPVLVLSGGMGKGAENIYQYGIESIFTTVNRIMSLQEAMEDAEQLYYQAAVRMFRLLKVGMCVWEDRNNNI